jgi:hypothetical protein
MKGDGDYLAVTSVDFTLIHSSQNHILNSTINVFGVFMILIWVVVAVQRRQGGVSMTPSTSQLQIVMLLVVREGKS